MPKKINSEETVEEKKKTTRKTTPKKKTVKKATESEVKAIVEEVKEETATVVETEPKVKEETATITPEPASTNVELEAMLNKIAEDNKAQALYAKKQYNMSRITTVCTTVAMLVVLISALMIVPRIVGSLTKVESAVSELESVAKTLGDEVPALLESTTELIGDENSGLVQAVGNFNKFDIETLNDAINELKMAVEPFAKLFGGLQ